MDNNYKEEISESFNSKYVIQSKHIDAISHCIVFGERELLITMSNDGELNLYKQNQRKQYEHQSTHKVFDCPIVAYDLLKENQSWKLVLISFDNTIAACKIVDKKTIIVFKSLHFQQNNVAITSVVWGKSLNSLVLGGEKGDIFILDLNKREKPIHFQFEKKSLKLLRCGGDIYAATNTQISKLVFQMEIKSIVLLCQSTYKFSSDILDFAISQKKFFNFLVVLTKDKLYFFYLENLSLNPQHFQLKNKIEIGRLGWGKDYSEIGVYSPLKEGTQVDVYWCNLSGIWQLSSL